MNQAAANPDPLLTETEVAAYAHQKPATLAQWRYRGKGPAYLKIGSKVLYRRSAVDDWLASCETR